MDNLKKAWEIFVKKGVINRELIDEKIGYSWAKSKFMGLNPFTSFDTVIISDMDIAKKRSDHEAYIDILKLLVGNVDYLNENFDVFLVDTNEDIIFEEINSVRSTNFFKIGMKIDEKSIGTTAYNIYKVNKVISILRGPEHFYSIMHNLTTLAFDVNDSLGIFAVGPFMEMDQDRIKKLIDLRNKIHNYKAESNFESENIEIVNKIISSVGNKILVIDDHFNLKKAYGFDEKIGEVLDVFDRNSVDRIRMMMFNNVNKNKTEILVDKNKKNFEIIKFERINDLNVLILRQVNIIDIDYRKVELFYDEISDEKINVLVNFNDEIRDNIISSFLSKSGNENMILSEKSNSELFSCFSSVNDRDEYYSHNLYYCNDPFKIIGLKNKAEGSNLYIIDGIELVQRYESLNYQVNLDKKDAEKSLKSKHVSVNTFTNVENMGDAERIMIEKTLIINNYNMTKASKELGIGRSTLYRKMKKYGISSEK